jgi:hypothetical protein
MRGDFYAINNCAKRQSTNRLPGGCVLKVCSEMAAPLLVRPRIRPVGSCRRSARESAGTGMAMVPVRLAIIFTSIRWRKSRFLVSDWV